MANVSQNVLLRQYHTIKEHILEVIKVNVIEKVNITIDGHKLQVPANYNILQAANEVNVHIPTLCYLKGINEIGACRMCLVEIKGARSLQASCVHPVSEGMVIYTNSPIVRKARRSNLELILSNHDMKCTTCIRSEDCELQKLTNDMNITEVLFAGENTKYELDDDSPSIVRDNNKCILCRRCIAVCKNQQSTAVIGLQNRGFKTNIGLPFGKSLNDVACIMCGQCITVCPTSALREKDHINRVWNALADEKLHVIVQTAPAVRVALGEEFGMPVGSRVTGKMAAALRRLGFSKVFDTNFAADLTIMEEGYEFLERLKNNEKLPLITSCSPGWVKFCEHYFPDFTENLSSCKSPHTMFGAVMKSYYAEKNGIDPKNIFVVSVMPCTAKKFEIDRPEMEVNGYRDVDAVITTRELARMIKTTGIKFAELKDEEFDVPFGVGTGAAVIFGTTGGVMEAALRTVTEVITGKKLDRLEFNAVRGQSGVKEFALELPGIKVKGCVVNGMSNARQVLESIQSGKSEYHIIEIMGCPGGCVTGGGQPLVTASERIDKNIFEIRAKAIYDEDESLKIRSSHENPYIKKLYEEFLGEPNSHKAHHLLHTTYTKRAN